MSLLENKGSIEALRESSQNYITVCDVSLCKCKMQFIFVYENKNGKETCQ